MPIAMRDYKKQARAEFITASQALDFLTGPKGPPLRDYATGRRGETRRDMAQACLIKAHTRGRVNLVGRKGDVTNLDAKSDAFERIPNEYFARDVILGDSLVAPSRRRGEVASGEFWRDVKVRRREFEAKFKLSSAEDALRRWWKTKTKQNGKPPTERDAYLQFAQQQQPKLPRRWLTELLKKLPKSERRKGSGRPPNSARKQKADSAADSKAQRAGLKAPAHSRLTQAPIRAPMRPKRISKDGPTKGFHPDYRHIIRQKTTGKTTAGWKVNLKRRNKYMHKYFPDAKYGGEKYALEAAQAYHDSLMSVVSNPDYMLWRRNKKPRTNTSGIVGVGRYVVKYRKGKRLQWQAAWQDADGKQHCKIFLVSTHGERQAKALAIAARRDAMAELHEELIRRGAIYD